MSPTDHWLAIVNPVAGPPRSLRRWDAIEHALRARGVPLEITFTQQPHDGAALARAAVRGGHRRLIVAGGDGSFNDVLNGVMSAGLADVRDVTLAVAPTGTGNDWARAHGIAEDPDAVADVIAAEHTMLHDVGLITGTGVTSTLAAGRGTETPGVAHRRWFINVAGAGYDAYVSARVPRPMPSTLTYFGIALRGLLTYEAPFFHVEADGTTLDDRMLLVFVANAPYCGNRMHVAPAARMDDGRLDVVAVHELGFLAALPKLVKLYGGTLPGDPAVHSLQAEHIVITTEPASEIQADGQMCGSTPAEFRVLKHGVRVVVPAPAA